MAPWPLFLFLVLIGFRTINTPLYCLHLFVFCLGGEKEEGDDGQDLRRTESDSGLKKVRFPRKALLYVNLLGLHHPFGSIFP